MTEQILATWVVTDHPVDMPDVFVARMHVIESGGSRPTTRYIAHKNLAVLEEQLRRMGLVKLMRNEADDPVILSSWF
jgi:hypothetical protein